MNDQNLTALFKTKQKHSVGEEITSQPDDFIAGFQAGVAGCRRRTRQRRIFGGAIILAIMLMSMLWGLGEPASPETAMPADSVSDGKAVAALFAGDPHVGVIWYGDELLTGERISDAPADFKFELPLTDPDSGDIRKMTVWSNRSDTITLNSEHLKGEVIVSVAGDGLMVVEYELIGSSGRRIRDIAVIRKG